MQAIKSVYVNSSIKRTGLHAFYLLVCMLPWVQGGKVKWSQMPMYVVPTGPGRGRVLWWLCIEAANLPAPFKLLAGLKPKWLEHVKTRNLVFEGAQQILLAVAHAVQRRLWLMLCRHSKSQESELSMCGSCAWPHAGFCSRLQAFTTLCMGFAQATTSSCTSRRRCWQRTGRRAGPGSRPSSCPCRPTSARAAATLLFCSHASTGH